MSDAKLRDLERRCRETGSLEDEAAFLRERVRVSDLTQERLELAALCRHAGALQALGRAAEPGELDLSTLVSRLRHCGPDMPARAAILLGLRIAIATRERELMKRAWRCAGSDERKAELKRLTAEYNVSRTASPPSPREVGDIVNLASVAMTDGMVRDAMKACQMGQRSHPSKVLWVPLDLAWWALEGEPLESA